MSAKGQGFIAGVAVGVVAYHIYITKMGAK